MAKIDRRYKETREYSPGRETSEALTRADQYRARMRKRRNLADESPERSSYQASGELQQQAAARRRDISGVFDQYGSGEWGSGDDSVRQLRREAYSRSGAREL